LWIYFEEVEKMKTITILFVFFLFLLLLPHLGSATGINIRSPNTPLSQFIRVKEKLAIEKKLQEDKQGAGEIMAEWNIPSVYMLGGRALSSSVKLTLSIRNSQTKQTVPFPKGTKIWFEMQRSEDGENFYPIPSSDWIMGKARVLDEITSIVLFSGLEIIQQAELIVDERFEYCLYVWVDH
jgi:hypothetical protein